MGSDFPQLLNTGPANGSIWAAGYRPLICNYLLGLLSAISELIHLVQKT
jgi:hypothetical protein